MNTFSFKNVVTYKPVLAYIILFIFILAVFFTYSLIFYVSAWGLIFCMAIVVVSYTWISYGLSKNMDLSFENGYLIIKSGNNERKIRLSSIEGFYFHDETYFRKCEIIKKNAPCSLKIILSDGSVIETNNYSFLFSSEPYNEEKSVMLKRLLKTLLKELNFTFIKKNKSRSFQNLGSSWYAKPNN